MKKEVAPSTKIIFWLLLIVFVLIVVFRIAKTEEILRVLATGRWYWIALALLMQLFLYPFYAYYAGYVLGMFQVNLGFKNIFYIYLASKFTDVALPISTVGEVAIFVRNGRKLNFSSPDTGAGAFLILFFELVAFTVIALISLLILFITRQSQSYLLIPIFVLVIIVLGIIALLIRTVVAKRKIGPTFMKLILWLAHLFGLKQANRENIELAIKKIGDDLSNAKQKIYKSFGLAFLVHSINLLTLTFIFLAFAGHFNFFAILATYVGGILFTIISITPQGVGVAETIMITTMRAYGIDLSAAAVITLAFRGLLYWLPMFAGFYAFSHLELKQQVE